MKFQYVLLVALVASCGEKQTAGKKAGACYGNGSCDEGLVCEAKICVAMFPDSALGAAEKFVADVCACESKACTRALYENPGYAVFKNVEEKRVEELEARYEECVEARRARSSTWASTMPFPRSSRFLA
ncbi:MAG: hypothetical protein GY811_17040 [Myxococcales bacterium]|nr:hypothetical protein [Myxococcales bacterium]